MGGVWLGASECTELLDCWEGAEETDCGPMANSMSPRPIKVLTRHFFSTVNREEEEQGSQGGDILVPLCPSCSFHSLYLHFTSAHCELREALSAELSALTKQ